MHPEAEQLHEYLDRLVGMGHMFDEPLGWDDNGLAYYTVRLSRGRHSSVQRIHYKDVSGPDAKSLGQNVARIVKQALDDCWPAPSRKVRRHLSKGPTSHRPPLPSRVSQTYRHQATISTDEAGSLSLFHRGRPTDGDP
jgi:hypothetical protein